jgi:hypothetical protein
MESFEDQNLLEDYADENSIPPLNAVRHDGFRQRLQAFYTSSST